MHLLDTRRAVFRASPLQHAHSFNELAPLLEITTKSGPTVLPSYQFGASFFAPDPPNGAGRPERAIQLMEYGIQHNPDNWRLYYNLGFIYYTELKDYKKAGEVFLRGSRVPNAHPVLKVLAALMNEHAGDFTTARMLWTADIQSSSESNIRENAAQHLRSIKVDEDVTNLQAAVSQFGQRSGRLPFSLAELSNAMHFSGIPVDPDGNPYKLAADGRVLVQKPEDFPFITKGLPPDYKPPAIAKPLGNS